MCVQQNILNTNNTLCYTTFVYKSWIYYTKFCSHINKTTVLQRISKKKSSKVIKKGILYSGLIKAEKLFFKITTTLSQLYSLINLFFYFLFFYPFLYPSTTWEWLIVAIICSSQGDGNFLYKYNVLNDKQYFFFFFFANLFENLFAINKSNHKKKKKKINIKLFNSQRNKRKN